MTDVKRDNILKALLPSLLGVFVFLAPIPTDEGVTVLLGLYTDWARAALDFIIVEVLVIVMALSCLFGAYYCLFKPDWETKPLSRAIGETTPVWLMLRFIGTAIGLMVLFEAGPEVWRMGDTGVALVRDVTVAFAVILVPACFLMPLLTDFGAMEFVGTLVAPIFRRAFHLPGRAAIDATTSFVASFNVGILMSAQQYHRGFYSAREAVTIVCNFSVVSLPFALVIAKTSGMSDQFFPWYFVCVIACIICAIITPRIPPLSTMSDDYVSGEPSHMSDVRDDGHSIWGRSVQNALAAADNAPNVDQIAKRGVVMFLEQLFRVSGPTIALGTVAAVLAFHSPIGGWLSAPVTFLLSLFDVSGAENIAPGFIFGYLDQFIPAIVAGELGAGAETEVLRFMLAGLSLTQLIFMSGVGVVALQVGLPVTVRALTLVFLWRTIISIPILFIGAWMVL